jgi:uncharacterized SAM-binding protein YcdF (DUF218 family)
MFFILSKIFAFCIKPIVWIIACFLLSFFLKNKKRKQSFFISGLVLLILLTNDAVFQGIVHWWEPEPVAIKDLEKKYDFIILLGGYSDFQTAMGKSEFQLGLKGGNRLITALSLYKKGIGTKIILTGGSGKLLGDKFGEAEYVAPFLKTLGLPDSAFIIENKSRNTWENAVFSKQIVDSLQKNASCLLVTSALHMPRSKACYDKAGLPTTIYPTDYYSQYSDNLFKLFFEPSSSKLYAWEALLHEWIGVITYKIKGYN